MKLLSALIVDDEVHGRNNLANLLSSHCPEIVTTGFASNASEATKKIKEQNPDVVFLDIMMPGMNGLDFLDTIPERTFASVLVTAYSDFGIKAVKSGVVDYIMKPIDILELKKCIPKIYSFIALRERQSLALSSDPQRIVATHAEGFSVIDLKDMVYLEADGNYTKIQLNTGENLLVCRTLKDFEDTVPLKEFFRIQKSFLINLRHVKKYLNADGGSVIMSDNRNIPVSRKKNDEFFEQLRKFVVFP